MTRWRKLLAMISSTSTLAKVWELAVVIGVYSLLPVLKEHSRYRDVLDIPSDVHTALSTIVGLLLVFRTNAAYARWWEARQLWGQLVNVSRNLIVKVRTLVQPDRDALQEFGLLIIRFANGLLIHLRVMGDARRTLSTFKGAHVPLRTSLEIYEQLQMWKQKGLIDGETMIVLDTDAHALMNVCGGCERIVNTPISPSYRTFVRLCIMLYLLSLPWGLVHEFDYWTIPLTTILAYFMIGFEIIAESVEEPFGHDDDDLDLEGICRAIEVSVRDITKDEG